VVKARVCNVPTGFWLSSTGRSTVIIAMGPLSCFDLPRLDEMRGDLFRVLKMRRASRVSKRRGTIQKSDPW
jgi:hypothetical protein